MRNLQETGYENAFVRVASARLVKKEQYGDSWKEMEVWELLAMIKQKYGRLEFNIINEKKQIVEKDIDNLIDLINYSLFLLQNILDKEENV